jgi:nicotinamide riboside transporter PnuC
MEALLAIFLVKIPSIAGIGGLIAGLLTLRLSKALTIGAVLGVIESIVLEMVRFGPSSPVSWVMAILAAMLMAFVGWFVRLKIRERK